MQSLTTCCGGLGGVSHFHSGLKNCIIKAPNPGAQIAYPPPSLLYGVPGRASQHGAEQVPSKPLRRIQPASWPITLIIMQPQLSEKVTPKTT